MFASKMSIMLIDFLKNLNTKWDILYSKNIDRSVQLYELNDHKLILTTFKNIEI